MTIVKVSLPLYRITLQYLCCVADDHCGKPISQDKKAGTIEFRFDTATEANAFRKVLDTTFLVPASPPPVESDNSPPC